MRKGEWPEQVIFTAEEVASILSFKAMELGATELPQSIIVESKNKYIIAFSFNLRTNEYHSISTTQVTHWKGQ